MAARRVFVDTGAWFALIVPRDRDHDAAVRWHRRNRRAEMISSDHVIVELVNLLVARGERARVRVVLRWLLDENAVVLVRVSDRDFEAARATIVAYDDKAWSFTDCTSKVVIQRLGIERAFSFDCHFQQFGHVQVEPAM